MKWISFTLIIVFGLGFGFIYVFNKKNAGDIAPHFTATLTNGEVFDLKQQQGNYTLLAFWGSWCAPCLVDNPKLVNLHQQYNNQQFKNANGFDIIGIAIEKNDKRTKTIIQKQQLNWKQIIHVNNLVLKDPLALKYGVTNLPTKILIDAKGKIIGRFSVEEVDSFLKKELVNRNDYS